MQTKLTPATKKARANKVKEARKASKGLVLQRAMKDAYEKELRGMNALINYCTGKGKFKEFTEGLTATQAYINYVNERDNASVKLSDITVSNVTAHLTERELFQKNGEKRKLFSTHYVKLAISRMAK